MQPEFDSRVPQVLSCHGVFAVDRPLSNTRPDTVYFQCSDRERLDTIRGISAQK
jgi:hypothetical protein